MKIKMTYVMLVALSTLFCSGSSFSYDNGYDDVPYDNYQDSFSDNYYGNNDYNQYSYNEPQQYDDSPRYKPRRSSSYDDDDGDRRYDARLPSKIVPQGEKVIIVDPRLHRWGAYNASGQLLRSGLATAGAKWCPDIGRPCRTRSGTFRIYSLGSSDCISKKYPVGEGGAPMPYCMYFNGGQGLHGSYEVAEANLSHGCVRLHVSDAHWIRFNFANYGTKVIVRPY